MKLTKKTIAAAHKIVMRARSFDTMLSGEIPTENGVIITDGILTVHSPVSFGEPQCMHRNPVCAGGNLKTKLIEATNVEKRLANKPFELRKVASTICGLCKEFAKTNEYKKSFVTIEGLVFDSVRLVNAFDIVGRKACGYIANHPNLFNGSSYLIIEPENVDYENDIYAILLPFGKVGD